MLQLLQTVLVTGCMLIATALSRLPFRSLFVRIYSSYLFIIHFSTVCMISDSLRRRQTDASKLCHTGRHLLPDVYVMKPDMLSAFLISADSLRCDFSYICVLKTLLCLSQHFGISFAGMLYTGRSYHLAAKGSRYLQRAMRVLVTGMIF